jgi:hypothetical protein
VKHTDVTPRMVKAAWRAYHKSGPEVQVHRGMYYAIAAAITAHERASKRTPITTKPRKRKGTV